MALYRKSSIEKLSNPEQLDKAITISSPLSWLILIGLALGIAAVLLWSVRGSLPVTVTASGVAASPADACAVYAECGGVVTEVLKNPGDPVQAGEQVAVIHLADGQDSAVLAQYSGTISTALVQEGSPASIGSELFRCTPAGQGQFFVCYVPAAQAAGLEKDMKVLLYPAGSRQGSGRMEGQIETVGAYPANVENMRYVLGTGNLMAEQFAAQGPVTAVTCRVTSDSADPVPKGTLMTAKIITQEAAPITRLLGGLAGKEG